MSLKRSGNSRNSRIKYPSIKPISGSKLTYETIIESKNFRNTFDVKSFLDERKKESGKTQTSVAEERDFLRAERKDGEETLSLRFIPCRSFRGEQGKGSLL